MIVICSRIAQRNMPGWGVVVCRKVADGWLGQAGVSTLGGRQEAGGIGAVGLMTDCLDVDARGTTKEREYPLGWRDTTDSTSLSDWCVGARDRHTSRSRRSTPRISCRPWRLSAQAARGAVGAA